MNSLKNLLIIGVLAAVGYGVYVAMIRNNVDPAYPTEVAERWQPNVDMSGTTEVATGGSLPIGMGTGPSPATPPPTQPAIADSIPPAAPPLATAEPYPSSASAMPPPSEPTAGRPMAAPPSTPGEVKNLAPPPETANAESDNALVQSKFQSFMEKVRESLKEGKLAEAHLALSMVYTHPDLRPAQAEQIIGLLDQLAGTVIYSRKHYLEPAYHAKAGETIERIAQQYNVPWQLLARINGLMPPGAANNDEATKDQPLPEGMELKVLRGPFDAVVDLDKRELTLMLHDRYAGRFPIGMGRDQANLEGVYTVQNKILDPAYYGADGVSFAHDDPQNPLGEAWIGLSDRIGIHGAADSYAVNREDDRGSIRVSPRDIRDLYGILSVGSRVKVVR
ncbi:MAG: L,D-transpeptidase family protein [Pirellulales bacterium]|nr:L,D-transpeptidase family protein [Pirellulales bacterium]